MIDIEKIKKGLQCIIDGTVRCESCGYAIDKHGHHSCQQNCASEAIALLKEQERKKGSWDYGTQCSACKGTIIPPKDRKVRVNFCPWCGAEMLDLYEQEGR